MKQFLNSKYLIWCLLIISLISALRNLFFQLVSDEIQYAEIGKNIVTTGQFYLYGQPSTFTPTLPFLVSFFYIKSVPFISFTLVKLFNLLLMIIGLKYSFLFLKKLKLPSRIVILIIVLSAVNNATVVWSTAIYPEPILFCALWIFLYYVVEDIRTLRQVAYILVPFLILVITRYVYAVLIPIVAYYILKYLIQLYKDNNYKTIRNVILISFICLIPLLIWFKYVVLVEQENSLNVSYFTRFKNKDIFYNLKAGLGLIKHEEVDKVNGIPAFISLFVPVTGIRNWIVSIILIISFSIGLLSRWEIKEYRILTICIFLVMLGLIFAGTGFSRYWLVLLPGFWVGFYLLFIQLKLKQIYFENMALILATLYIINELRLDYIILNKL